MDRSESGSREAAKQTAVVQDTDDRTVACVGLGFVGYHTALAFCESDLPVVGIDTDDELVSAIRVGEPPFTLDGLAEYIDRDSCYVTPNISEAETCNTYIVSVPTPLDKNGTPDLSYVEAACRDVAKVLQNGDLVVIQSTVFPGATRTALIPELERSGLKAGREFGVSHVPERYSPGNGQSMSSARIVGSLSDQWCAVTADLYEEIVSTTVPVSTIQTAETIKLIENVQRDVNIALMNEVASALMDFEIDIEEVLDGAATKWNFHRYEPSLGVGGHCLPIDPYYFIAAVEDAGEDLRLIPAARHVNEAVPSRYCNWIVDALERRGKVGSSVSIAVLGVTYKPHVKDIRNSPALELVDRLRDNGLTVDIFDPEFEPNEEFGDTGLTNGRDPIRTVRGTDIIVVGAGHDSFANLDPRALARIMSPEPLVVDPHRILDQDAIEASALSCLHDLSGNYAATHHETGCGQEQPRNQSVSGDTDD